MNTAQMFNAAMNPQQFIMQQAMQNMIRENPSQWQQAQQMFNGKSPQQQRIELEQLYKSKGMDLQSVASQWGIQL